MHEITFGSVCSGIEAASVAWHEMGWSAAWFCEIDNFASQVLNQHYPSVPNYGDMTMLPERIRAGEVEAPEVLCGGTPCQAFSVAGARNSLADARGNLTLIFCEVLNAIDDVRTARGECEAIAFWENVPGVLSTDDNAFGCFLAELAGDDTPIEPGPRPEPGRSSFHWRWNKKTGKHVPKWTESGAVTGPRRTIAWRVFDAQYFGLAQRRKRVFLVASARNGFDPCRVLFEFEGLRRDIAPSREAAKEAAGYARAGLAGSLRDWRQDAHAESGRLRRQRRWKRKRYPGYRVPGTPVWHAVRERRRYLAQPGGAEPDGDRN